MKYADYALMITILILAIYQFILEILYLLQMRKRYFTSFWNHINLISIGLNVASVVIDYKNLDESKYWIPVSSSAMVIMWLRLFYFGRIINSTSTIVRMIIEISKDMVPFLVIVFIIVFGFANWFYIIATITYDDATRFTTNNVFLAIAWTWRNGVGDFHPEDFSNNRFLHLVEVIWLVCTFWVMIVFLNLLIAVLSDSFDKIQETLENNLLKEMAIMMSENEILVNRKKVFKDMKYLIVIQKVLSKKKNSGWGGRLNYVNNIIKKTRNTHIMKMDKITRNLESQFDLYTFKRATEMEVKYDKSINYVSDKIDKLDIISKQYIDLYYSLSRR